MPGESTATTVAANKAVITSGVSFPLWIDYFDCYSKVAITVLYLIIAMYSFYSQVVKPIYRTYRTYRIHKRKRK